MKVVLTSNALGLGGTEKGLETHALHLAGGRSEVRVVSAIEDGPRRARLEAAGVRVDCAYGDGERLASLLRGADVVHVFRAGTAEPLVPRACRRAGVETLVETNVFGAVDASHDESSFSCHLFVGKFCALRYRRRLGLEGPSFHTRHRVSHWPVDIAYLRALAPDPAEAKRALGLDPRRPVVGRLGRADDRKWRNLLVDMVAPLAKLAPDAQVLFIGPTPAKLRRLDRLGLLERVHFAPPTASEERLALMYAACDVYVTAAEIGESYSYAIEEAMALGIPIVTCSTPWVDDGQVEQVDDGVTGYLADHPAPMAEAVAGLLADAERRAQFGAAARSKAERLFDAERLTRQLERLYGALLAGEPPPGDWAPSPDEVDAFGAEYERRRARCYRALTERERAESRRARRRERMAWATRAARRALSPELARHAYWTARASLASQSTRPRG